MPPWLNSKLTMLPWCPLSLSPCLNLSHRAFGIHIASWWFQGFLERKQQQQNKPFFHGKVQGCLPYGEMGRLLPGYLPLQLILPSCLDEKGPSLMVSLSGPCIICRQFRGEEIAFCLINNSTVCQNQASPTFPTVQASGMLGIKSWTELFSVWECLISCLKWEHFFFPQLCRELHTCSSLSFSFNIWNDFITNYDSVRSEYIWEHQMQSPSGLSHL